MKKISVILLGLFILPIQVSAMSLCDAEEVVKLDKESSLIKIVYEEKEATLDSSEYHMPETEIGNEEYVMKYNYFDISVINITENFYVILTNSLTNEEIRIDYKDLNEKGIYTYEHSDLYDVLNLTATVYTSSETSCPNEKINIKYLTVPRYNEFSAYHNCEGYEDEKYCSRYVTFERITENEFFKKIADLEKSKDGKAGISTEKDPKKIFEINKGAAIVGVVIIGIGVTSLILYKRKGSIKS